MPCLRKSSSSRRFWLFAPRPLRHQFELTDLAVVVIVLFVAAVGRVLDLAVAIKAENDQIV